MQKKKLFYNISKIKPLNVKQMQKKHRYNISNSKPFVTAAAFSFCMMRKSVDDVQSVKIANKYL